MSGTKGLSGRAQSHYTPLCPFTSHRHKLCVSVHSTLFCQTSSFFSGGLFACLMMERSQQNVLKIQLGKQRFKLGYLGCVGQHTCSRWSDSILSGRTSPPLGQRCTQSGLQSVFCGCKVHSFIGS